MAKVTCNVAPGLFTTTCMDNLVIKLEPYTGTDGNCFTKAYPDLTLADLIVSPEGDSNDTGKTCVAAEKSMADLKKAGTSTTDKFWGAVDLETAVGSDAIYFSASSCGIEGGLETVSSVEYMQFKTTLMSQFTANAGDVLTQQHMLETAIICNYQTSVDGISVAINPQLDAVEEANKIDQDEDTNEIDEDEVTTVTKVDTKVYVPGADVTLGSAINIDFSSIGELTSGYYIDSCVADNEYDSGNGAYKSLNLVTNGCAAATSSAASMATIKPVLGSSSTDLSFDQFAFVDASSTFDAPVLKFELNCVLKFGTAPTCSGRKRRALNDAEASEVSVTLPIKATGPINYSAEGIATLGAQQKSAESGATEMMISAMAAAGFLLL